jgi:hypothetical protein
MVNVYVGPKRAKWYLHEDLLCKTSQFFRSTLKGSFKEASDAHIELPEDDADSFDVFVRWLYGGDRFALESPDGEGILHVYLKLYVLALRLIASTAGLTAWSTRFNSRAEICILRSQTHSFSTIPHFWLYLPNAEMTLDLEVNEVEVKVLTSLASVTWITAWKLFSDTTWTETTPS